MHKRMKRRHKRTHTRRKRRRSQPACAQVRVKLSVLLVGLRSRISQRLQRSCWMSFPWRLRCCSRSPRLELLAAWLIARAHLCSACNLGADCSACSRTSTRTRKDSARKHGSETLFQSANGCSGREEAKATAHRKPSTLIQPSQLAPPESRLCPRFSCSSQRCRFGCIRGVSAPLCRGGTLPCAPAFPRP